MSKKSKNHVLLSVVSGVVVASAIILVVATSSNDGDALEYFKDVHQALAQPEKWVTKRLRLHGNVVAGTIQKKKSSLDYRFAMHSGNRWVEVTYRGLVPDTFKDCAEVVVKGKLTSATLFEADDITAKCPSKYEEKERLSGCGTKLKPAVIAARGK